MADRRLAELQGLALRRRRDRPPVHRRNDQSPYALDYWTSVQVDPQQHVTIVDKIVMESNNDHRDAWEVWDLSHVFDAQWINLAGCILNVG